MKRTLITAAGAALAAPCMAFGANVPVAHADTGLKVIVNHQDITPTSRPTVACYHTDYNSPNGLNVSIQFGGDTTSSHGEVVVTPDNQPVSILLIDGSGNAHGFASNGAQQGLGGPGRDGDASVIKSGLAYKITGHVSPQEQGPEGYEDAGGAPVPFEFDATCPAAPSG